MAAVINTNYLSLVAQNNLNKSQSALGTAIERLSSGLRINSAKDDAAGMAIANRFTANVKGLTQAARNANDGISLAQTTEGASSEVNTHLQRVRELAVQAGNGNYSQEQLDSMQDEINQRLSDIDRISQQTDFNGVKVLSAAAKPLTLQVGANDGETITLNLSEISVKTLGLNGFNVNGKGVIDNRAANVNDMSGPNVVAGANNTYTVTTTNVDAKAADVLGKFKNGDSVSVPSAGTTYTYNAANDNYDYTAVTTKATTGTLNSNIKAQIGNTPISATYTNKTQSVSIKIDGNGLITDANGNKLYSDTKGSLVATDSNPAGGTYAQAKLDDLTGYMADNTLSGATAGTVSLSIGSITYKNGGAADTVTNNATASKDVVLSKLSGVAATVKMGQGLLSTSLDITTAGAVTKAGTPAATIQVDGKGELTDIQSYTSVYQFDQISGKITSIAGGDTKVAGAKTGVDQNASNYGKQLYMGANGKMTFEKTSKGDKTGDPLKTLDSAFKVLNKLTGELGAVQNRLESTIANLNNVVNNLSGARSRIQDADYATEVSNMSKNQILQQAGTSVLAQANQVPQTVLSLLR